MKKWTESMQKTLRCLRINDEDDCSGFGNFLKGQISGIEQAQANKEDHIFKIQLAEPTSISVSIKNIS